MRRSFTFLTLATLAVTAVASPVATQRASVMQNANGVRQNIQPSMLTARQKANVRGGVVNGVTLLSDNLSMLNNSNFKGHKAPKKADADVPLDVIDSRPEGSAALYARSGDGTEVFYGYVLNSPQGGSALETVTSADGKTMYLKDFIHSAQFDTYVKADVTETGFSVPTGQMVLYNEGAGYGLYLGAGKYTTFEEDGKTYYTYELDESVKSVNFTKGEDGSYKIDSAFTSEEEKPEMIVTLFYSDDDSWSGYSNWNTAYTPFSEEVSLMPDGVEVQEWAMKQLSYNYGTDTSALVKCAIKDGKFYIAGINPQAPNSVLVGTISGDKVTFAPDQYLGLAYNRFAYFVPATYELDSYWDDYYNEEVTEATYTLADSFEMTLGNENKTLTPSVEKTAMILNAGTSADGVYFIKDYDDPEFSLFVEVPATPATPVIITFEDLFDEYEYNAMESDVPVYDVDGNFINPNKLYYIVWTDVDGDKAKYTFYSDTYIDIPSLGVDELVEVPYYFTSLDFEEYEAISEGGTYLYFYDAAPDKIGLQSVYLGGDERHESEIFWYDISGADNSEVNGIDANKASVVNVYGVDGLRRASTAKGLNLVRMSDGSVRKVIVK